MNLNPKVVAVKYAAIVSEADHGVTHARNFYTSRQRIAERMLGREFIPELARIDSCGPVLPPMNG